MLSASNNDDKIAWYENTAGDGTAFTPHTITTTADRARSVAVGDVDGDGDTDVLSASWSDDKIAWYQNRGGQFALETADTAPGALETGQTDDLLKILMSHRGRAGDHDQELTSLDLLFEEMPGDALSTAEVNALVENLHIFRDTGSGIFEPGSDTLVTTVANLTLSGGVQTVEFTDGDPNVLLSFGDQATFFVVAELTADALVQTPNSFQVTHVTESTSTAEDAAADLPLSLEFAADVSSSNLVITADTTSPTIVGLQVSGSGWGAGFLSFLGTSGFAIPVGDGVQQLSALPWTGIDEIHVVFSEEVVVAQGDLSLLGVNVPSYTVTNLTTGPGPTAGTFLASWTLQSPIGVDKLRIDLSDTIQDLTGNALDGEWDNPTDLADPLSDAYPSGNGTPGGDFQFRFNVLPGNASGMGTVDGADYTIWANNFGLTPDADVIKADFNADGSVDGADYTIWANSFGDSLPVGEPLGPAAALSEGISVLLATAARFDSADETISAATATDS